MRCGRREDSQRVPRRPSRRSRRPGSSDLSTLHKSRPHAWFHRIGERPPPAVMDLGANGSVQQPAQTSAPSEQHQVVVDGHPPSSPGTTAGQVAAAAIGSSLEIARAVRRGGSRWWLSGRGWSAAVRRQAGQPTIEATQRVVELREDLVDALDVSARACRNHPSGQVDGSDPVWMGSGGVVGTDVRWTVDLDASGTQRHRGVVVGCRGQLVSQRPDVIAVPPYRAMVEFVPSILRRAGRGNGSGNRRDLAERCGHRRQRVPTAFTHRTRREATHNDHQTHSQRRSHGRQLPPDEAHKPDSRHRGACAVKRAELMKGLVSHAKRWRRRSCRRGSMTPDD